MRLRLSFALAIAIAVIVPASAHTSGHYYYLNPTALELSVFLPPPPDADSAQERSDEEQVAAAVAARSPAQLFEAEEASKRSVFFFASAVGPQFTSRRLPLTARFFSHMRSDVQNLIDEAKTYWDRPRPSGAPKRRGSYPSGHAAFASSAAIVLSQLIPSKRDAIFAQARKFAVNRIILGLHYPTDVASGWTAGTLAAYVMMRSPAFQRDYAAVKAELRRADL
jgi:acid phosphatase (class A)